MDETIQAKSPKGRRSFLFVFSALAVIAAAAGLIWWYFASQREETEDAYVDGHISNISSRVSGTITAVRIEENQRVNHDQPLVLLDPKDYEVAVDQARAVLEKDKHEAYAAKCKIGQSSLSALGETTQATGDVKAVEADIASARAALLQAQDKVRQAEGHVKEQQAQLEFAQSDFERYRTVYENRAVTKQQYDKARQSLDVIAAQLQQAKDSLSERRKDEMVASSNVDRAIARLKRSHGSLTSARASQTQSAIEAEHYASSLAAIKRDEADLEQKLLQLSYTKINAPVDGKIGKKFAEVGQRIEPGQTLMSLVQDDYWVTANFKETQVGRMRVGQPVELSIDTFGDRKFKGSVESLSPASGAKFSMLPPDNASGNFTKVVQRIPVRIGLNKDSLGNYKDRLAPGMSCVVAVYVGR
jgi:membrane fusion protein (multidrug efflux system)